MDEIKKNIALAGLGYWGKNVLRNLHEIGVLHSACDASKKAIETFRQKYPDVNYTMSFDDLLENSEIEGIAIAAPAVMHYDMVKRSLLAGKDVYVEKPLALTVRDGEELVAIAEREGRILMVGHILQYHPAVRKLKEMIMSGELGKVQYVYSNRLNIGKLRTEENILWSFAPHDISVILMLLGEEPLQVNAFGEDYLSRGVYDTTLTAMDFANGVKGHIFVSWLHPFKEQKLVVVGSQAMAVFDDVSSEKLFLYPHKIEWHEGKIPVAQKAECRVVPFEPWEPLREELSHFAECVNERKQPLTDGHEGLRVLKILERAEASMVHHKVRHPERKGIHYSAHESSYVDDEVEIGDGTKIWHFSHILKGTSIGRNCVIGQNVTVGPDVTVGNRCKIQNNVSVYKGVVLEDDVFCGPSCVFTNVYNPRAFIERKHEFRPTIIRKGATIGANATIVCGVTVGRYALIGAGAVVKKDVPDYAVMAGVPARRVGWACRCGAPLRFDDKNAAICGTCSNEYESAPGALKVIKEG